MYGYDFWLIMRTLHFGDIISRGYMTQITHIINKFSSSLGLLEKTVVNVVKKSSQSRNGDVDISLPTIELLVVTACFIPSHTK